MAILLHTEAKVSVFFLLSVAEVFTFSHFCTELSQNLTFAVEADIFSHFCADLHQDWTFVIETDMSSHFCANLHQNWT